MAKKLSHGGRYYRAHRERELYRKVVERARWESAREAFLAANPDLSMTDVEFRALAKRSGWLPPEHRTFDQRAHTLARGVDERRRRFVESALGRSVTGTAWRSEYGGR
jgi:hypothetical protein